MSAIDVLERIRQLARRDAGLYRVHRTHGDLYARARRQFGTWAAAVQAAGSNYQDVIERARRRSIDTRRRNRQRARIRSRA